MLKKIAEPGDKICDHPEHSYSGEKILTSGDYEWTCPGCNTRQIFTISGTQAHEHEWKSLPMPHRDVETGEWSSIYCESCGILKLTGKRSPDAIVHKFIQKHT